MFAHYHVMDASCRMNDPNGPVYDSRHKMYHLFFQAHLALPGGDGPVWAHVASRDLVHWARLPVALWNDRAYDSEAVYTGSATIVNGGIVQVLQHAHCAVERRWVLDTLAFSLWLPTWGL